MPPESTLTNPLRKFQRRHTPTEEEIEALARGHAATTIQRAWRKRQRASYLSPDLLWQDVSTHARMKISQQAAEEGQNKPQERWRRAIFFASRLQDGNGMSGTATVNSDAGRKQLETQHWLELVDPKHRYGANLKYYHRYWTQEQTKENFFRWLDRGGGKEISLPECPRERLEQERIIYLSPEQRLNYLVEIDNEGKLRWARNGNLVDTTADRWKDAGSGGGIVPADSANDELESPSAAPRESFSAPIPAETLSSSEQKATMHYVSVGEPSNPARRFFWKHFTIHGLLDKLLRKTIRRNTWIYVSDNNFNIFVGLKDPGKFQHSSFLAGGLVTSAGLITVKDGVIHTLSPLSGHYRTSIAYFRRFLSALEERGVDMDKVKVSKAELLLWGIEHLAKLKKKQSNAVAAGKRGIHKTAGALKGHHKEENQADQQSEEHNLTIPTPATHDEHRERDETAGSGSPRLQQTSEVGQTDHRPRDENETVEKPADKGGTEDAITSGSA